MVPLVQISVYQSGFQTGMRGPRKKVHTLLCTNLVSVVDINYFRLEIILVGFFIQPLTGPKIIHQNFILARSPCTVCIPTIRHLCISVCRPVVLLPHQKCSYFFMCLPLLVQFCLGDAHYVPNSQLKFTMTSGHRHVFYQVSHLLVTSGLKITSKRYPRSWSLSFDA